MLDDFKPMEPAEYEKLVQDVASAALDQRREEFERLNQQLRKYHADARKFTHSSKPKETK